MSAKMHPGESNLIIQSTQGTQGTQGIQSTN
jgi:hypothetical protein